MEITTTMVRFPFYKGAMEKKTEKAQLFLCGETDAPVKIWVPLNKMEVKPLDDEFNEVIMPKWIYMKGELPLYTNAEEFIVKSEIAVEQLG